MSTATNTKIKTAQDDFNSRLSELRGEIDGVDEAILKLLAQRREISLQMAQLKNSYHIPLRDIPREKELFENRVAIGEEQGLDRSYVEEVFFTVLNDSRRYQKKEV
ncbi:MAG: chorismate mutase [Bdellovibrionales bacterium]|nr:chorismate mutase [Bdellovibrionales bacterium]